MVYAQGAESFWTGKVIIVQNVWKRLGNTTDKTENFTEKIIYVVSVGKLLFQMEKEYVRSAEQNVQCEKKYKQMSKNSGFEKSKSLFIMKELKKEYVLGVGKEKRCQVRKSAAFASRKMPKCIEKNMRIGPI